MKKPVQNFILFFGIVLTSAAAFAAAGGDHGDDHIPLDKIGWQAANLGILLVIIYFGIRKSIVETFAKRKQDFLDQSEKTKAALQGAEAELKDIKSKLALLESGEAKAIENAKHEANLLKATLIKEAEAQAAQLKIDAELMVRAELAKAKQEINATVLKQAILVATEKLNAGGNTSKRIEAQFLAQVENAETAKASI